MGMGITVNTVFTGLDNPLVRPKASITNGLVGLYDFTSGDNTDGAANKNLINHAYKGAPPLTVIGTPQFKRGRVVVGGGNGFATGIDEPIDLTYIIVQAIEDAALAGIIYTLGDFNNDPAALDYGIPIWLTQVTGVHYFSPCSDSAGTTTHVSNSNTTLATVSPVTDMRLVAGVVDTNANNARWHDPKANSSATRTISFTAGALAARNRTRVNAEPVEIRMGTIDDTDAPVALNGAISRVLIYNRALSAAEINTIYTETKAQLQALAQFFEHPTRYAGL